MTTKLFGAKVPRVEDQRFLRGQGRYVDDLLTDDPRLLHAAVLRSPHAHARIVDIDVSDVLDVEGVIAVWTYDDLTGRDGRAAAAAHPAPDAHPRPHAVRAGQGRGQLRRRGDRLRRRRRPLRRRGRGRRGSASTTSSSSPSSASPPPARRRASCTTTCPATSAPGWSRRTATPAPPSPRRPHTLTLDLDVERSACTPMEGRGTVARWDPDTSRLTVWSSTQTSTGVRGCVAAKLGLDLGQVDVITPDVGGGFGVKINHPWPEELLVPLAAMTLGRPVKFTEDRREHFISSAHERAQQHHVEVGFDDDGRLLGLNVEFWHDHGAYTPYGLIVPIITSTQLLGPYKPAELPRRLRVALHQHRDRHALPRRRPAAGLLRRWSGRWTRSRPTSARTAPRCAATNFIQPDEFPYDHGLVFQDGRELTYDSGDYPASLEKLKELVGWDEFEDVPRRDGRPGPPGRHRPRLLRRGHRRRPLRGRPRAHRDLRQGQGRDRPDHAGPGPPDGVRADRRRHPRRAVRGRRDHHRRHPPDAVRRRHLRLARRRDERVGHPPRRPAGEGEGAADRGRGAGGVRGRPRDRRRRRVGARHRRVHRPRHRRGALQPAALRLRRGVQGRHPVLRRRPRQAAGGRGRRAGPGGQGLLLARRARPSPPACTP